MSDSIIGIIMFLVGFLCILRTYKNRNIISVNEIFDGKDKDKYKVVNEKKFLRLQNIKSLFKAVYSFSGGILILLYGSKVYILTVWVFLLGILVLASNFLFSNLAMKYVRSKK